MIQKLEAAAKLLNKMLHDDRRHRAFLQERLDTAEVWSTKGLQNLNAVGTQASI